MKRSILILSCIFAIVAILAGCGTKGRMDEAGNTSITSEWHLVEFTVKGNTTRPAEEPFLVRLFTVGMDPKFSCKDGVNCTFTNGRKSHNGTVREEEGAYMITFDDTTKQMKGVITDNRLTLTNEKETVKIVFEAVQ